MVYHIYMNFPVLFSPLIREGKSAWLNWTQIKLKQIDANKKQESKARLKDTLISTETSHVCSHIKVYTFIIHRFYSKMFFLEKSKELY